MDKIYNFQILLPNGTTVCLKLQNPEPKILFRDFLGRVEKEYVRTWKQSGSLNRKREINWKGDSFLLVDAEDVKIQNVVNLKNFNPQECHILRLQDGLEDSTTTFENMWDLTPDTDLLKELPQEYTFETALADLIDNSLQAVLSNDSGHDRHISVVADEDMISIFDNGPGMDASDENSIVKWGKMGASLHRSYKEQAIGGKPPYLKPFFGMFGYGGPIASMQLGRRALVSSKTKDSKKVYTLNLDRKALLSGSWKTGGSMRDPEEDEISRAPHGSFTKVTIFEPKSKMDTYQLQCKLKDIYFPYIQYDEDTKSGKTIMPVKFEVNGVDLAEVEGGEIAITNTHSCNGPDFVLQLQFSFKQENMSKCKSPDSKNYCKANAHLKCVYFPIQQGKENIDKILEKLGTRENFETFSRVSIRRLGRLLPDARWGLLPFMDLKQKRGMSAELLKRCCLRVKCFIETDAGFNPTSSKTDVAYHSPFTAALMNIGYKPLENENDIKVEIYKDGNLLNPSQLEKKYEDWLIQMHAHYDDDGADCGEDQPVSVIEGTGKGTIVGVFRFDKGLAAFVDSRTTHTVGNNKRYGDSTVKFDIICRKSNLFFVGAGKHEQWRDLVKDLQFEVMSLNSAEAMMEDTDVVVSIEEALALAQKYLHSFARRNPNYDSIFAGILIGVGPEKKYQAYQVSVVKKDVRDPKCLTDFRFLICGSGTEIARSKLRELNVNPQARTETMSIEAIKASTFHAYLNTPSVGGSTNVFLFYDGIEISAVPNLVLDPLSLHLEKHADECDRIILLLLNKNAAGLYDQLEQELTAWPEVVCTSRVTGRKSYWLYRVLCHNAASANGAFLKMIEQPAHARDRDMKIDCRFRFFSCNIGGVTKNAYAAPCSLPLLQFLNDFNW